MCDGDGDCDCDGDGDGDSDGDGGAGADSGAGRGLGRGRGRSLGRGLGRGARARATGAGDGRTYLHGLPLSFFRSMVTAMRTITADVELLGGFRVTVDGRPIPSLTWEHRRAADLVKLLALAPSHRMARDRVIDAIWPHLDADAGGAALHKAASQARSVLGFANAIVLRGGEVALAPEGTVTTDVSMFERAARAAFSSGDANECARAAALYPAELLPTDRYADWAFAPREQLRNLHVELLRRAGAWKDVLAHEPTDEAAHLALMRVYAGAGHRAAALRQFRHLRELLSRELGVAPSREAVALYEEISRGPAVHAPVFAARPLVGRQMELARVRGVLLSTAAKRRGATLLIRGEPGVGKTRFCDAILMEAASNAVTTLRGTARLEEGAHAFAPVVEAFDRLLAERPDLADQLTESARRVIARLATSAPEANDVTGSISRQQVLSAAAQLMTIAAKERPVLLLLDDLHAADESTIQLVHYLARHARFDRIVLVVAYRPGASAAVENVERSLLGHGAATAIELGALTRSECRSLVEQVTKAPVTDAAMEAIWRAANGNPFITELLAASESAAERGQIPEHAYDIVEARLTRLDDRLAETLQQVAVLGRSFSAEALIAFLGLPETEAFRFIDDAVERQLFDVDDRGYRFRHALLREGLVRRLPAHRQREAHGRAADALAGIGASASRVASHLERSGRLAEATPWLGQAARDAASIGAFASALELVDRALGRGEPDVDLLSLRAEMLLATGDPRAPDAFESAKRRARGSRREALRIGQTEAHIALGDMATAMERLAEIEPPDAGQNRLRYLLVKGSLDWLAGRMSAAESATEEARKLAADTDKHAELAEAVVYRAMIAHSSGRVPELLRRDLLDIDRAPELAAAIHEGHLCGAELYLYGGQPYEVIADFARELRRAGERCGARRAIAFATCLLGETALLTGDLGAADSLLEEAAAKSLEIGARGAAALAMQRRAESAVAANEPERATFLLALALDQARNSPMGQRHLLQRIYGTKVRGARDAETAMAAVDEAEVAIAGPMEGCFACMIALAVPASIACAEGKDLERAHRYLTIAEHTANTFWRAGAWFAAVAEARGTIALAKDDRQEAGRCLTEAAELFADAGHRLESERCRRAAENLAETAS